MPRTFDQITARAPDVILIDLTVGIRSDRDLLERLAHDVATQEIPVIDFSTSPAILERVFSQPDRCGGQPFLSKPVDLDAVVQGLTS